MAKRPFISKRIDELEQLFKSSGRNLLTLQSLENELAHRSTPRAVRLLKAVRKHLSLSHFSVETAKPNLFDLPSETIKIRAPHPDRTAAPADFALKLSPTLQSTRLPVETKPDTSTHDLAPLAEPHSVPAHAEPDAGGIRRSITPEEACKILQVTLAADWESIEKSRREIVQNSHPSRIRSLPPERRRTLEENALRANDAAHVLLGLRIQEKARTLT